MKECHRCEFHKQIMAGLHKNTPYEKMPCATCPGDDVDGKNEITQSRALRGRAGETRLSMTHETIQVIENESATHEKPDRPECDDILSESLKIINEMHTVSECEKKEAELKFREIHKTGFGISESGWGHFWEQHMYALQKLADVDYVTRELVFSRLANEPGVETAERLGLTPQAAHQRIRSAMEKYEWVRRVIDMQKHSGRQWDKEKARGIMSKYETKAKHRETVAIGGL